MDPKICREHLDRLISDEVASLRRLAVLLDKEHEYILANDIEALDRAGEARQTCVGELLRIEDERRSLCRMMNLPSDVAGIDKLLTWCDSSRTLQRRWAECAELATNCRSLNDRNGALVTVRLKRVEGLLDVLTGRSSQPKVYGSKGGYDNPGRSAHVLATV